MGSRHLLDPEVVPLFTAMPSLELNEDTLGSVRAWMAENPVPAPGAPDVEVTEIMVPTRDKGPGVRVLVYRPTGSAGPLPALLHCHGGGFVLGSPDTNAARNRYFAQSIQCLVVSVDYRLPPETPFPGPVEDCYDALCWLHNNATQLDVDANRIAIGGQSAGGGLAAALGLLSRDRGEVPVAFQLLIYPMLDDRTGAQTEVDPHLFAGEFGWTRDNNRFGWKSMLGVEPGGAEVSPYASPARAGSLSDLPPTFIGVGALDLFVEENILYANRLIRAGVPTELHVYPGAVHGFDLFEGTHNQLEFERTYHEALRRALHPAEMPGFKVETKAT